MNDAIILLVVIVFFVIAANFFMVFRRLKRNRHPKISKAAMEEIEAAQWRDKEIKRRLDREQEEAERYVELRNKTFELYEQVRKDEASNQTRGQEDSTRD
ncbi:MAG: hypothetical protein FWH57_06215 [Oscillospiraceae bacterium]|nr:hypothetical protein [Oscillospiraceae bacterium]MCL2152540.1 hypothetical protein [Oscillospiraceae bacterium]